MNVPGRSLGRFRYAPAAVATAVICYLALKPSPEKSTIPLVPRWLGTFLDHHDFLCNVAGYLVLTAVVHATFASWRHVNLAALARRTALLCVLVTALECAQQFIPRRCFDPQDIVAGTIGVILASLPWLRIGRPVADGRPRLAGALE